MKESQTACTGQKATSVFVNRIYGLVFVKKMQVFPTYLPFVCLQRVSALRSAMKEFRIIKVEISKIHVCYETNTVYLS